MAKQPKTYTSTQTTQADGQIYRPGEPFTTAAPKGEHWEEVKTSDLAALRAPEPIPADVPIEKLETGALQAIAVEKNINPEGLDKKKLIAAIKAADEPRL